MKQLLFCVFLLAIVAACNNKSQSEEWVSLFNGENLDGWTPKFSGFEAGDNYKNTFRVNNGILDVNFDNWDKFEGEFGHLITEVPYAHYKLRVEYRFLGEQVSGGPEWAFRNNGLMLHSQAAEAMAFNQDFPVSIEVQLLGSFEDLQRTNLNICTPGTLVDIDGETIPGHCYNSVSPAVSGDQWVRVEIEVYGDSLVRHIENGEVVLEYTNLRLSPDSEDYEKLKSEKTGDRLTHGRIAIQAESHPTQFRRIELLDLSNQ
jgi:hypothetical protein